MMSSQDNEYDCWFCTLADLLKIIGEHCKHIRNITSERHIKMMWIDDKGEYHFESHDVELEDEKDT